MIFSALVKLAALIVLLMLGGIIVSLIISSPSIQKFGFAFCGPKSGMRLTDLRRAGPDLRNRSPLLSRC